MLPYSREHEREADSIGLTLMAKAGYNPNAAVDFWKRFSGGKSASMLDMFTSTHPCDEERIELISSQLDDAMKLYRESANQKDYGVKFNDGIPEAEDSKEDSGSSTSQGEVYITI